MATDGIEIDLNSVPENPEDALRMLEAIEAGTQPAAAPPVAPETAATPTADTTTAASEPSSKTQQADSKAEPDPEGVATKDGKHVIPYSVLKSERDQRTAAQTALQEALQRVTNLEAAISASAKGANSGAAARAAEAVTAEAPAMSDADLEALKDDFPTVYKALKATMDHAARLEQQVRETAGFKQEIEAASQRNVEETVQDAIDSNPKLAHIQSSNQAAFKLAQSFDDTLKSIPEWASKPMSERFAKVIEMVEQTSGEIKLPGGKSKTDVPTANAADLKQAAQAAAAAQAKASKTNVPVSLSEFPVGEPPAQDERNAVESMTHFQLAAKLGSMSPEKMEAYLANL